MAYDQSYYQQQQQQRPYNGGADRRAGPGPRQGYGANPPQQQYPPQQYDQYPQEDYGYDGYENGGYGQDYDQGYQDMNGGGRGNYPPPPQNGGYPPQQEYYGNDRGGGRAPPPRGGGMPPGRGGPMQRPPTADGMRGGYDQRGGAQGRGYPNGGPVNRGGGQRPGPPDRSASSDPGMRQPPPRKPLKTPPMSPDTLSYDNPFPTFPGAKKKTSASEEREILQKMDGIQIGAPPPRKPGSKGPPRGAITDDYGRPSMDSQRRGPPTDDYGRPSGESQRSMPPRGYPPQEPPQQGYPDQRRAPPGPNAGYGPPARQNTYEDPGYSDRGGGNGGGYGAAAAQGPGGDFGPPSRSKTMPMEPPNQMGRQPPMPAPMNGPGPSAPYNGPLGRGMPPRPSTGSGNRPPPQRQYPTQAPPQDPYANGNGYPAQASEPQAQDNFNDFYDSYYDAPDPRQARPMSSGSEMPNFDALPVNLGGHRRGASIDQHIQPPVKQANGYQQVKPMKSQPDIRGQAQPQTAIFEMAGDIPPMPNALPPQGGYQNDGYGNDQYNQGPVNDNYSQGPVNPQRPPAQNYGYSEPPLQVNGFDPPPRSASAAPRSGPGYNGLPNGGPRGVLNGFPNGPSPQNGQRVPGQRIGSAEGLPNSKPPPIRAGLIPNSVAAQAVNRPPPVRNYGNTGPMQQAPMQPQASAPTNVGPPVAETTPVSNAELEQLRNAIKVNPNDQTSSMLLVKKLVEASEVLVPLIPDQRQRNKIREKYLMDAFKLLKKLVQMQNSEAMFYLADCYGRGALGLETDTKEAFTLYQSAAKAGHAAAAYRTAVCCELGNDDGGGTRKDPLKAIQWYKRAATLGDTPAMYKMGMIQLKGLLGQPKNPREAVGWLKRAADRADAENPHALHELGLLYEQPQSAEGSVVRDESYSFQLFSQAAELGYKFSQFRLGAAYEYGLLNCPIDPRQSIMWYSRAAAQEEHQSELALSGWYLTGSEGVLQQSDTEAYLWARKAAISGLAKAEYAMGYFTEVGIGAPAALEDAKRWYWRAAAQNFPKARERLEDLKRNGGKGGMKARERISRSKVGKQQEGECVLM